MKRGTVYRNPYVSIPTYYIYDRTMPQRGREAQHTKGYEFTEIDDGKWEFRKAEYYKDSLPDFEIVGNIGNPDAIIEQALKAEIFALIDRGDQDV